jgi:photosystem II stability/assembly factor-like uncharacterized protein
MRIDAARIAIMLCLMAGGIAAQEALSPEPPEVPMSAPLTEYARQHQAFFAKVGTGKGTGYRQYKRREEFIKPRNFPSGDPINFTALSFAHHYRATRSPEFQASKAAAAAAGVLASWHPVRPADEPIGIDTGRINALAFSPSEPMTVYAGTPSGGLWRTQDDGTTWTSLTDSLPMLGISDIAIDPLNPRTVYILTGDGEGDPRGSPSIGVLKSVDHGETWQATGLVWKIEQVQVGHRLAIHPTTPAILLAATTAGLLRTTDGGTTWAVAAAPPGQRNPFWDVLFHPTDPSVVYAASQTNVYRSTDTGATWTELEGGLPDPSIRASTRIRLAVSPAGPDTLYVLYAAPSGFTLGLWRSDDRGSTFTRRSNSNSPPTADNPTPPFDLSKPNILHEANNFNGRQAHYDLAMAVSPTDINRVVVGGLDIWRSDDGGRTWSQKTDWRVPMGSYNYSHADIHVLAYRGDVLFTGSDGGAFRTDDEGEIWTNTADFNSGGGIRQIYSICITPQDPNLIFYGSQDNGTWKLEINGSLTKVLGGDGMVCRIDPKNSNTVYASVYFGYIMRSDDGGMEFKSKRLPPTTTGEGAWVTPYVLGVDNSADIYACFSDLWVGKEAGAGDWKNLTRGALGASNECAQVAIAPSDPKTIYVAKAGDYRSWRRPGQDAWPPFLGGGGVFRSTDTGATWENITGRLPFAEGYVTDLTVSPTDPRRVWVTFSGYRPNVKVFSTIDGGRTWTNLSAGLPNLPVSAAAAQNNATHGVFIGTDAGVFYRDDRSNRWLPFSDGMPTVPVTTLAIDETRNRIFAGTYGRGVWLSDLPCQENCPAPQRGGQAVVRTLLQPRGYIGPVEIFE